MEKEILRAFANTSALNNYCYYAKKYNSRSVSFTGFREFLTDHYGRYVSTLDQVQNKSVFSKLLAQYYRDYKAMSSF